MNTIESLITRTNPLAAKLTKREQRLLDKCITEACIIAHLGPKHPEILRRHGHQLKSAAH